MFSSDEKICLIQRYFLYNDIELRNQLLQSRKNLNTYEDICNYLYLQARYDTLREMSKDIEKILYMR